MAKFSSIVQGAFGMKHEHGALQSAIRRRKAIEAENQRRQEAEMALFRELDQGVDITHPDFYEDGCPVSNDPTDTDTDQERRAAYYDKVDTLMEIAVMDNGYLSVLYLTADGDPYRFRAWKREVKEEQIAA